MLVVAKRGLDAPKAVDEQLTKNLVDAEVLINSSVKHAARSLADAALACAGLAQLRQVHSAAPTHENKERSRQYAHDLAMLWVKNTDLDIPAAVRRVSDSVVVYERCRELGLLGMLADGQDDWLASNFRRKFQCSTRGGVRDQLTELAKKDPSAVVSLITQFKEQTPDKQHTALKAWTGFITSQTGQGEKTVAAIPDYRAGGSGDSASSSSRRKRAPPPSTAEADAGT